MLVPCGYQHSSHRPRRGWHESRCRWLSSAGSAGASQSAWPRRGWRWARRPPRMLHHEEMSAPAPLLPACQPVLHPCRWEGPWSDRAQKPSIGSAAEESRRVEAPHRIPPRGLRASNQRLLLQQERSPNPGCKIQQHSAGSASGGKRRLQGLAGLLLEHWIGSNSPRTLQKLQPLQRLPQEQGTPASTRILANEPRLYLS